MALHQWGGGGAQRQEGRLHHQPRRLGRAPKSATQDIGTGARTVLAIIAAEVLGLKPTDIISNIGNSTFPPGQASGRLDHHAVDGPACLDAATKARDALFKKIAPGPRRRRRRDLSLKGGKVLVEGEPTISWKDACRKLGMMPISRRPASARRGPRPSSGVAGCQFAEVTVDTETGVVRLNKIVAVQDSGLIIDMLTWESQVYGGVIMGLNYGLFEERVMDPTTGVMLNPDMEMYKLAGASDIPEIVVERLRHPRRCATAASSASASRRRSHRRRHRQRRGQRHRRPGPEWPMIPLNVLNALATAPKKGRREPMKAFDYAAPTSVEDAVKALGGPRPPRPSPAAPTCSAG